MTPGKIASQAGHAFLDSYLACLKTDPHRCIDYKQNHGIKVTLRAKSLDQLLKAQTECENKGIFCCLITDLGYTVFDGKPTITALGMGPVRKSELGTFVKKLQLMD